MRVGVITYQAGHLKTWQILKKLLVKPLDITVLAFPFFPRPPEKKIFEDRPYQIMDFDIRDFCHGNRIEYIEVNGWSEKDTAIMDAALKNKKPDVYLTCIAKIIPEHFISGRKIINAHPGLLPENRGLDAFKWAVVNAWPLGVSLHIIDKEIDKGIILHRVRIPVLKDDLLCDVAQRAYEMECDLQANFDHYVKMPKMNIKVTDKYPLSKKRIPEESESRLEDIFIANREKLAALSREKDGFAYASA